MLFLHARRSHFRCPRRCTEGYQPKVEQLEVTKVNALRKATVARKLSFEQCRFATLNRGDITNSGYTCTGQRL